MSDINDDDEAYLVVDQAHTKTVAMPEEVWAKISDDGELEILRWELVEMYAAEFDTLTRSKKDKSQTHVLCKLLVLVRDQTRKECGKL